MPPCTALGKSNSEVLSLFAAGNVSTLTSGHIPVTMANNKLPTSLMSCATLFVESDPSKALSRPNPLSRTFWPCEKIKLCGRSRP